MRSLKYWYYRAIFRSHDWIAWNRKFPIHLDLELAGKCQLACTMCPYGTGDFDASMQGMMPLPLALRAMTEARKAGAMSIKLNFRGEPGLCKWLANAVAEAKGLGYVDVMINTNLTSFTEPRLKELVDAGIDKIIVSIDGATAQTYTAIRKKGDWRRLRDNMEYLANLRGMWKRNPEIIVQCVKQEANRKEMIKFQHVWGELCDKIIIQKVSDRGAGEGAQGHARKRCPQPWQRLIVGWDGSIFPCCSNWNNEYMLGNYNDMSLKDAWNGKDMQRLRDINVQGKQNKAHPCKFCQVGASYK